MNKAHPPSITDYYLEHLQAQAPGKFTAAELVDRLLREPDFSNYLKARTTQNPKLQDPKKLKRTLRSEVHITRLQRRDSRIVRTDERPFRLYVDTSYHPNARPPSRTPPEQVFKGTSGTAPAEASLYPKIIDWLQEHRNFKALRIDERESGSRSRGENHWRFPDIVALRNPNAQLDGTLQEARRETGAPSQLQLWSLEVKSALEWGSYRTAYFQAVSNSSWAHEGYLAAPPVRNPKVLQEIETLVRLHGIGLIEINPKDPARSHVLLPARQNPEIDWHVADHLHRASRTFRKVTEAIKRFYKNDELILH